VKLAPTTLLTSLLLGLRPSTTTVARLKATVLLVASVALAAPTLLAVTLYSLLSCRASGVASWL